MDQLGLLRMDNEVNKKCHNSDSSDYNNGVLTRAQILNLKEITKANTNDEVSVYCIA